MKLAKFDGDLAWAVVCYYITEHKKFTSVTGIVYDARIQADEIVYKGGNRNGGQFEAIAKRDFIQAFEAIRKLPEINTNIIKDVIPNAVYRKRTPLIGMLHSAHVLR